MLRLWLNAFLRGASDDRAVPLDGGSLHAIMERLSEGECLADREERGSSLHGDQGRE